YEMIDGVVLDDAPIDSLTEDQLGALKRYVEGGGLLIVCGGSSSASLSSSFLRAMLPVHLTGATEWAAGAILKQRYHSSPAGTIELSSFRLKSDATTILQAGDRPLVVSWHVGNGVVLFTAFDCLAQSISLWSAAPSLWRDLLLSGNREVSASSLLRDSIAGGDPARLMDGLAGSRAIRMPPLWIIGLFCGAYVVLLSPVQYLALKRINRRDLGWVTVPLSIAVFSIAAYAYARRLKGGRLEANLATVVEMWQGSSVAAGYSALGVYSPVDTKVSLLLAERSPGREPSGVPFQYPPNTLSGSATTCSLDAAPHYTSAPEAIWTAAFYVQPAELQLKGPVEAFSRAAGHRAIVTIRNSTGVALYHSCLVNRRTVTPLGTLRPGQTAKGVLIWDSGAGTSAIGSIPELPDDRSSAAGTSLRNGLVDAMGRQGQIGGGPSGLPDRLPASLFVAWLGKPISQVHIDGRSIAGLSADLLVVHLSRPSGLAGAAPSVRDPFSAPPALSFKPAKAIQGR
ncbi:MAG TPA: hypothetical protein VGS41_06825, partial [Chthonomonadales bacterium]|nr:hypothetical protein [Chthonomonadales bacterium]